MEDKYDAIVLGTGLTECIISGMLSVDGYKVLHIDKNDYYGSVSASLQLDQLYEEFKGSACPAEVAARDYNVDLVPKFLMAEGKLVRILTHLKVTRYLDFMLVDGSYVTKGNKVCKVPSTAGEALKSSLMGFFQKRKCKNFFTFCDEYDPTKPKTHKGFDPYRVTTRDMFKSFDLSEDTVDFIGHAVALHTDDSYLDHPAIETMERVKLYERSFSRWGQSPYIYPLYGLGELPQAFARLCAVCGGTYMLSKPVVQILTNEAGESVGVECEKGPYDLTPEQEKEVAEGAKLTDKAFANIVVGEPSYFPEKVRKVGQVVRAICILSHPVPETKDSSSCQIILPQRQTGRQNDIYICVTSSKHRVAPEGKYIAVIATRVETDESGALAEIEPALSLLGSVDDMFVKVYDLFEPLSDGREDKTFISKSYDATTHFESVADDVLSLYERITGKPFDWEKTLPFANEDEEGGAGASGV